MAKTIVFWLGRSPTPWDHLTALDTGIGGSEVAALRLTSALVDLGHKVTVYADILRPDAADCNPRWLPFADDSFPEMMLSCDLLVSSRCPSLGIGARDRQKLGKPTWLWMHDLHVGADWGNAIGQYFDRVICLSKFAKERFCQYYPKVEPQKVDIIPNGIYQALYKPAEGVLQGAQHVRYRSGSEPLSFIWSSCPDRGLDRVLSLWPRIRQEFPGSRLHVYGDFYNWASRCRLCGSSDQQLFAQMLAQRFMGLTDEPESGVFFDGKAGQFALAKAFCRSHVWFYPTSFEETSCITAMEAQAAGTKVVCTTVGALPETVTKGVFLSDWRPTKAWEDDAIAAIRIALDEPVDPLGWLSQSNWGEVAEIWNISI